MPTRKPAMEAKAHEHAKRPSVLPSRAILERAAGIFKAVSDPGRLQLLLLLAEGERCVSELSEVAKGEGLSLVSQRLRVLRSERLVQKRREGKHIYYSLADTHVKELLHAVLHHARE
ncbi:MAG: helix-turn-helix transcriptional regulator [Polyangiaceae bacterium]|nr:helix-turn-helix transcriptional regulator [Polyangiaceae bacterium]